MGTKRGVVKKTELTAFSNPRAGGIIAMGVEDGDAVIAVQVSDGSNEIFIGTRDGMSIRFPETDVRPMGRTAYGVRGIELRDDDEVVAMEVLEPGGTILSVTEQGYGKRTELDEYRVQTRGGIGIINIQTSDRNGKVVGIAQVHRRRRADADHAAGQDPAHGVEGHPHHRPRHAGRAPDRHRGRRSRGVDRAPGRAGRGRSGTPMTEPPPSRPRNRKRPSPGSVGPGRLKAAPGAVAAVPLRQSGRTGG